MTRIIVADLYRSSYGDNFDFKSIFLRWSRGLLPDVISPNGQVCEHVNGQAR